MRHRQFKPLRPSLRRALVIQIDHHLGNTVLSLPTIQALANHFAGGVDVLVDARYADLARRLGHVNRVICFPAQRDGHGRSRSAAAKTIQLGLKLVARRYQAVVDLSGSIRSSPLALLTAAPRRFGYADARKSWCCSHVIDAEDSKAAGIHAFDRYGAMLRCIGFEGSPPLVRLQPSRSAAARVEDALPRLWADTTPPAAESPLVVMHPSAGIAWRRWPAERFAEVANGLIQRTNARVLMVGVEGDRELAEDIGRGVSPGHRIRFVTWPLEDLIALFARADLLVSNESGPTHVAAAVGTPIVTIFGPTSETLWRPLPVLPDQLVVMRGAACDPACHGRTCAAAMRCLTELSAGAVLRTCLARVRQQAEAGSLAWDMGDPHAAAPVPASRKQDVACFDQPAARLDPLDAATAGRRG